MRSVPQRGVAGQLNLKGKKTKLLSCGCCVMQNFKSEYFRKLSEKEAKNAGKVLMDT